jgi:hypothetical protein
MAGLQTTDAGSEYDRRPEERAVVAGSPPIADVTSFLLSSRKALA